MAQIILTGDRPSGPLHLGHYVGSLKNRISMQQEYETYILIADTQALSACFDKPEIIRKNILQVLEDYLACGIDEKKCHIFLQSAITALPEIMMYYMNFVTLSRVSRNPTVKTELMHKNFADNAPCGFICHPISQAADITAFKGTLVPVGEDQIPMIEQTNEIVRKFNSIYKTNILKECKEVLSSAPKLFGIDGKAKASKSLNNCIFLNDSSKVVKEKVLSMYTDPNHIRIQDKGSVKGNMVFHYLDIFDKNEQEIEVLKANYEKGGLGDIVLKNRLFEVLENFLEPIRERRSRIKQDYLIDILNEGTKHAQKKSQETLHEIKHAIGLKVFNFN